MASKLSSSWSRQVESETLDCAFANLSSSAADLGEPLGMSVFIEQVVNALR